MTLAYTGELTMTGARVSRAAKKYLGNAAHFAVTYGDGVTDADLGEEYRFHLEQRTAGHRPGSQPALAVRRTEGRWRPRSRNSARSPNSVDNWINGGYFFFHRDFLPYLSPDENCVLERDPLIRLARDGQLGMFKHRGFWACMDTQRDLEHSEQTLGFRQRLPGLSVAREPRHNLNPAER